MLYNRNLKKYKYIILAFTFFFLNKVKAQFPFEVYPKIKFNSIHYYNDSWTITKKSTVSCNDLMHFQSNRFYNDGKALVVEIIPLRNGSLVRLYKNRKIIHYFKSKLNICENNLYALGIVDIDGNGKKDIALKISYRGSGTASINVHNIFLFQMEDEKFKQFIYDDKSDLRLEIRDINQDDNYEIFSTHLQNHKSHNYFLYNVYRFDSERLVNVNAEIDYPIMIQFLNRDNFRITKNLSRNEMKKYSIEDLILFDWIK